MKRKLEFTYDPDVDAAYINLREASIDRTVDLEADPLQLPVYVDVDSAGRIVGMEILFMAKTVGPIDEIGRA